MRICFITTGDIESLATMKRAVGMAEPLSSEGHEVCIIGWDTANNNKHILNEAPHAEFIAIPGTLKGLKERALKLNYAKAWKPDIVYICAFGVRNSLTRFELGCAKVFVEHSELASAIPRSLLSKIQTQLLEACSVISSDGLICASRYLETHFKWLAGKLGRKKIPLFYHPYAYNRNILVPNLKVQENVEQINRGKKLILYMGTLAINYGILDILEGVKIMSAHRNDFILHVFGRGRHADKVQQMAKEMNLDEFVVFDGYVPEEDLGGWFSLSDVFLAPVYNTVQDKARCPSKVYMYLPFNKPIVSCKIGDPYDLLKNDGFYFEPSCVEDLARAMEEALEQSSSWKPKSIDAGLHSWDFRTKEFLEWIDV